MDYPSDGGGRGRRGRGRGPRHGHGGGRNFSAPAYVPTPEEQERWQRESAVRQIQQSLYQLGDVDQFDAASELPRAAAWLEKQSMDLPDAIFTAFRVMITEQPHKLPLTAALLGQLTLFPSAQEQTTTLGSRILDDLFHAYQDYVAAHAWRNLRLSLCFFASLLGLDLVSAASLREALRVLAKSMSNLPRSAADAVAIAIIDTMCRAGTDLLRDQPDSARAELDSLVESVHTYAKQRASFIALDSPFHLTDVPEEFDFLSTEGFEHKVTALAKLAQAEYLRPTILPTAQELLPVSSHQDVPSDTVAARNASVPALPLPIEPRVTNRDVGQDISVNQIDTGKGSIDQRRAETGPPFARTARWFKSHVPIPGTPASQIVRSLAEDLVDLYVTNRKECAQALLALPLWLRCGTFGGAVPPSKGLVGSEQTPTPVDSEAPWSLEDLIVETIVSSMLVLPLPNQNELYYASLLREVVAAAPQQIAPSLGRTIRRFYTASADGCVRAETLCRLADWFSVHLSNFNFTWAWSEWEEDLQLPWPHARRAFMRRLVELEVRLAYYDRIKETVPDEMQNAILTPEEPAPIFTYASEAHAYHVHATQLLNSLRAKASVQVIQADLQGFQQKILAPAQDVPDEDEEERGLVSSRGEAEQIVRDMAVQALLFAGSRSFSHLLNIIERYHDLLRSLSQNPQARLEMLASTVRFWARSPQWVMIVIDKLLQYRIVEPLDVVQFVFTPTDLAVRNVTEQSGDSVEFSFSASAKAQGGTLRDWSSFNWWMLICLTVDKVVGRVDQLARRYNSLSEQSSHNDPATEASAANEEAKIHLDAIRLEQRRVLVTVIQQFVQLIKEIDAWNASPRTDQHNAATWQAWWIKEWYREFLCSVCNDG
ncbi:Nuclear cap-binding protein subunit 1 [Malassezia psittaci]|uniref:Nuclear cap-binding protein subunit 1 n=1 Tax=Malassezia psittaci TaxID=1821823 RepID=A0AAF0FCE7_9BASI|nr:Nuclear cap-binding protein subunit 1 [Malassezia psittaci]